MTTQNILESCVQEYDHRSEDVGSRPFALKYPCWLQRLS